MTICLDTNVLLQLFGRRQPHLHIRRALFKGELDLAVSTSILLEYQEIVTRLNSPAAWTPAEGFLFSIHAAHGNLLLVDPRFNFNVIIADPDDNKFADCAIAAGADFIVTEDAHFDVLRQSGYRPQPITPADFINQHLTKGN